jgi:CheY-like chemotaxis protein
VAGVSSGVEAQRLFESPGDRAFDLVVIDFRMPLKNGLDVLDDARRRGLGVPPALLLVTSSEMSLAMGRDPAPQSAVCVHKPVRREDLLRAVRAARGAGGPAPASTDGAASHVATSHPVASTRRARILLVEDNAVNQMVAAALLKRRGFEVVVSANGREGVAAYQREPFDLILMDIQMPEMDGFEALTAIRTIEQRTGRRTPVVALTAHAMKEDRERCLAAGTDDYLSKPIEAARLYEIVRTVLDGKLTPA